jgi:hypothetical protein
MEAGLNETTLRIGWRRQMLDLDKMPARRRSTTAQQPATEGCRPAGAKAVGGHAQASPGQRPT